jgi:hypothetical protein
MPELVVAQLEVFNFDKHSFKGHECFTAQYIVFEGKTPEPAPSTRVGFRFRVSGFRFRVSGFGFRSALTWCSPQAHVCVCVCVCVECFDLVLPSSARARDLHPAAPMSFLVRSRFDRQVRLASGSCSFLIPSSSNSLELKSSS